MFIFSVFKGKRRNQGFTLVELMVVVVIVGILAAIAIPRFAISVLKGKLTTAEPYMATIASKMKATRNEYGTWLRDVTNYQSGGTIGTVTYQANDEDYLINILGVRSLRDANDFCFMVRVNTNTKGINETALTVDQFEVWAILRNADAATVALNPAGTNTTCNVARETANLKAAPSGSFDVSTAAVGGQGRVVVLHYPPYQNNTTVAAEVIREGRADVIMDWLDGISLSDAIQ